MSEYAIFARRPERKEKISSGEPSAVGTDNEFSPLSSASLASSPGRKEEKLVTEIPQ